MHIEHIFSNGPLKDFVRNPFEHLLDESHSAQLAAPYFTRADAIVRAARAGKSVSLLVGLNAATSPRVVGQVIGVPNLSVRYLTHRFHAKIFVFDSSALVGSSNLTDGGMFENREAVVYLNQATDSEAIHQTRAVFLDLWESAAVLTPEIQKRFQRAHDALQVKRKSDDELIEEAVGRAEPRNINVGSWSVSRQRIFLEALRRQVYEQYRPAFSDVANVLESGGYRRAELAAVDLSHETNRFLNWVRLTKTSGDSWRDSPLLANAEIRRNITQLGHEWRTTDSPFVPNGYVDGLATIQRFFASPQSISNASQGELTQGLLSLHAFDEQLRFVKGGRASLPGVFWSRNSGDVSRVKHSLTHLLHGDGDFIERLHDFIYTARYKVFHFGLFCALELFGTVKPNLFPPVNGRMAKALRFLGYDVKGD